MVMWVGDSVRTARGRCWIGLEWRQKNGSVATSSATIMKEISFRDAQEHDK